MNEQMRDILDLINEMSEEAIAEQYDEFDIELSEDTIIESGIIDINEDGILIEADDKALALLEEHGLILEETDWSKYDEPTVSRIAKGTTKPVDRTDYNVPPAMRDKMQGKPGFEKRKEKLKQMGSMEEGLSGAHDYNSALKTLKGFADYAKSNSDQFYGSDPAHKIQTNLALDAVEKLSQEFSKAKRGDYAEIMRDLHGDITGWKSEKVTPFSKLLKGILGTLQFPKDMKEGSADEPVHPDQDADDKRWDDVEEAIGDKFDPEQKGMSPDQRPGYHDQYDDQATYKYALEIANAIKKDTGATVEINAGRQAGDQRGTYQIVINPQPNDRSKGFLPDGDRGATPQNVTKAIAQWVRTFRSKGWRFDQPVHGQFIIGVPKGSGMAEAKYQGREVPLGKPMAGDVKKSKVYVKKPNGKVVKVNFGDKKMKIKKSNPKRRKSFRARHNCKNPGPRWKARYWSCRAW